MTLNDALHSADTLSEDIIDLLEEVGLTRKEVQIYEYLLNAGAATPSAIARDTAQPRGRIYEGMRNLVAKGFARERPTRPIQFCPTPLATVLAACQTRLSRHLLAVRRGLASESARARPPAGAVTRPMRIRDVSVIAGRRACNLELTRMLETANDFFWIAGGGRFADRLAKMGDFLERAKAAAARGVQVRIIFPRPVALARSLAHIDTARAEPLLRPLAEDVIGAVVLCATETASLELVSQPDDDATNRGEDVAIHINDPSFANRSRRRIQTFLTAPTPPLLSPWLGPDHGTDLFLQAVSEAHEEVLVLGSAQWVAHVRATSARNRKVFADALGRGVRLRAVIGPEAATDEEVGHLSATWQIRRAPTLRMWLTIVDGKEVFQAFEHPTLGGAPQFRRSSEPHEVSFYRQTFERLWASADDSPRQVQGSLSDSAGSWVASAPTGT